jgi:hypothetical protein
MKAAMEEGKGMHMSLQRMAKKKGRCGWKKADREDFAFQRV